MSSDLSEPPSAFLSAQGRTWLVCEHGPVGVWPLLAFGAALDGDVVLVTTSLSAHLLARRRGRRSLWISQWRSPAEIDPDVDDLAEAEIARARRFTTDISQIRQAASAIAEGVSTAWRTMPPSRIVIWEQWTRALARVVTRRALEYNVPTVVVAFGPTDGTVQVDRILGLRLQLLATRAGETTQGTVSGIQWRRPFGRSLRWNGRRAIARLGLHLDHLERSSRAVLGLPALIPRRYWIGYFAGRFRDRASISSSDTVPPGSRSLVLLALHVPAALGRFADPLDLLALCLDHVAPSQALVICPHPGDRNLGFPRDLWRRIRARPMTFVVRTEPTWRLLERTSVLITLTSVIGCESLYRGIPTLAATGAFFAGPGLAHPIGADGADLIAAATGEPDRFRPDSVRVNGFFRMLQTEHWLSLDDLAHDRAAVRRSLERLDLVAAREGMAVIR